MDKYEYYKNIIDEHLVKNEVENTDEIISAKDLLQLFRERITPLYEINNDQKFTKKVFSLYKRNLIKQLLRGQESTKYIASYCEIRPRLAKDHSSIQFVFGKYNGFSLYKNENGLFYSNSCNNELLDTIIKKCPTEIDNTFTTLEQYKSFNNLSSIYEDFNLNYNDCFEINFSFNERGNIYESLRFNYLDKDDYNVIQTKWYNSDRENLNDLLDKYKDDILMRIPVDVKTLDGSFKTMYMESKGKQKKYPN